MQNQILLPQQTLRQDRISALYMGINYTDIDTNSRKWIPMMRISWDNDGYYYHSYTKGFQDNYHQLKGNVLNSQRGYSQTWKDRRMTGFMNGRIPQRADSMHQYDLLGIGELKGDAIAYLSRSGGEKVGDNWDVFAEVKPNDLGLYHFYFPVKEVATLIGNGSESVKAIANSVKPEQKLDLKVNPSFTDIYCYGIRIGSTPQYLHALLSLNSDIKWTAQICMTNQHQPIYAYKMIARVSIHSSENIYTNRIFQPINKMPV